MATEERSKHGSGDEANELIRVLVRDLADLMQAQATVTKDLARLIDVLSLDRPRRGAEAGAGETNPAERDVGGRDAGEVVSGRRREPEIEALQAPARRSVPAQRLAPTEPGARTVPARPVGALPSVGQVSRPEGQMEAEPAIRPPKAALSFPPGSGRLTGPPKPAARPIDREEETEFAVEAPSERVPAAASVVAGEEVEEGEQGVYSDRGEGRDATVLLLESGNARVGVLWSQVAQVGSLGTPAVPPRIDSERGTTDLVSLGLLLHGVSREEKYFVVLDQDGERAAVACERMLGLGPLSSTSHDLGAEPIQVLGIPLLRTFGKGAQVGGAARPGGGGRSAPGGRDEDERDRSGPLRALVAVRYLPARVAICRHLRGRGWQVGEAAGLEAATVSLDLGHWDAIFLETNGNGETEQLEGDLIRRVEARRIPVIRVGSRISGLPRREGPAVMFPFAESELDSILAELAERPATG